MNRDVGGRVYVHVSVPAPSVKNVTVAVFAQVLGLTPSVYGYDPRADRWTRLPDLPIAVHGLIGSATIGDRIYVVQARPFHSP